MEEWDSKYYSFKPTEEYCPTDSHIYYVQEEILLYTQQTLNKYGSTHPPTEGIVFGEELLK
ncbi:MAG: hypothetical protein R2764_23825 [Bacteroidales bacterium]